LAKTPVKEDTEVGAQNSPESALTPAAASVSAAAASAASAREEEGKEVGELAWMVKWAVTAATPKWGRCHSSAKTTALQVQRSVEEAMATAVANEEAFKGVVAVKESGVGKNKGVFKRVTATCVAMSTKGRDTTA
jgi:hypothetical protein